MSNVLHFVSTSLYKAGLILFFIWNYKFRFIYEEKNQPNKKVLQLP